MLTTSWITDNNLGIYNSFYTVNIAIQANNANNFSLISGSLPNGLLLSPININGNISITYLTGILDNVVSETTYQFTLRCSGNNNISDQTFSLTAIGGLYPQPFVPESGNLSIGTFPDGEFISTSIPAISYNPNANLTYSIIQGNLPAGLSLSTNGWISGYVSPTVLEILDSDQTGFDENIFDTDQFDIDSLILSTSTTATFSFYVSINDGSLTSLAAYTITIERSDVFYNKNANLLETYSHSPILTSSPMVINYINGNISQNINLGNVSTDEYFYYQFKGRDFENDPFSFEISPNLSTINNFIYNNSFSPAIPLIIPGLKILPSNLVLNNNTGWLSGYINENNLTSEVYNFNLRIFKTETEPWENTVHVDYATELSFTSLNYADQTTIDSLVLNVPFSNFNGNTIIFANQNNFSNSYTPGNNAPALISQNIIYTGIFGNVNFGWQQYYDSISNIAGPAILNNQRFGVWQFQLNSNIANPRFGNVIGNNFYTLNFIQNINNSDRIIADKFVTINNSNNLIQNSILRYQPLMINGNNFSITSNTNPYQTVVPGNITVQSHFSETINWLTSSNLGSINIGTPSQIQFTAEIINNNIDIQPNLKIVYQYQDGEMPKGLKIRSDGLLIGRPSFQIWNTNDNTQFDSNITTFDRTYTFTVRAIAGQNIEQFTNEVDLPFNPIISQNANTIVYVDKSFTLKLISDNNIPKCNLYLDFLLGKEDKKLFKNILNDGSVLPFNSIYRENDPYYGISEHFRMLAGYGFTPISINEILNIISMYHYEKRYLFKSLNWATSKNYEVIFIKLSDQYTTNNGNTYSGPLNIKQNNNNITVYPATWPNMLSQLKKLANFDSNYLPDWMTTLQPDGSTIGFIPAIPLLYTKIGFGKRVLFSLQTYMETNNIYLNQVDAKTDRYYWDDGLCINYDISNNSFISNPLTTFDSTSNLTYFDSQNTKFFSNNTDTYLNDGDGGEYVVFSNTSFINNQIIKI